MRTTFHPLIVALNDAFYPALSDGPGSQHEVQLFALPARFGGLGIGDPVEAASVVFSSSHEGACLCIGGHHSWCSGLLFNHPFGLHS